MQCQKRAFSDNRLWHGRHKNRDVDEIAPIVCQYQACDF
jgi:hypothetical protein